MKLLLGLLIVVSMISCSKEKKPDAKTPPEEKVVEIPKEVTYDHPKKSKTSFEKGEKLGTIEIELSSIDQGMGNGNCHAEKAYFGIDLEDCLIKVRSAMKQFDFKARYGGTITSDAAQKVTKDLGKGTCFNKFSFKPDQEEKSTTTIGKCFFGLGKSYKEQARWVGEAAILSD